MTFPTDLAANVVGTARTERRRATLCRANPTGRSLDASKNRPRASNIESKRRLELKKRFLQNVFFYVRSTWVHNGFGLHLRCVMAAGSVLNASWKALGSLRSRTRSPPERLLASPRGIMRPDIDFRGSWPNSRGDASAAWVLRHPGRFIW